MSGVGEGTGGAGAAADSAALFSAGAATGVAAGVAALLAPLCISLGPSIIAAASTSSVATEPRAIYNPRRPPDLIGGGPWGTGGGGTGP